MGAEVADAASQMGHKLGAESGQADDQHESRFKKILSEAFHEFALRVQGIDPAARAAEQQAASEGGLAVQKSGQPEPEQPAHPGMP